MKTTKLDIFFHLKGFFFLKHRKCASAVKKCLKSVKNLLLDYYLGTEETKL